MKLILEKVFRKRENENKVQFILANSDISFELIQKAAVVATLPPYHTFGHALGATEQAVRIAKAEGRSKAEINLLVMTMLFHDAGHKGIVRLYDEMLSFYLASEVLQEYDIAVSGMPFDVTLGKMRDLIIATTFTNRGKIKEPLVYIVQDADLAHLGLGVPYWMWASMGLIDEFNKQRNVPLTPEVFITEEQEKFVKFLTLMTGTGKVFLSNGANEIFTNPLDDVKTVKNLPLDAINYAYDVRREDVTFAEFTEQFNIHLSL